MKLHAFITHCHVQYICDRIPFVARVDSGDPGCNVTPSPWITQACLEAITHRTNGFTCLCVYVYVQT